jgi:3-methyl-2-oxobutanoate hydroxymethyltransferase
MKVTLPHLRELKIAGTPIVMVTAYDLPSARVVDAAGVDSSWSATRRPTPSSATTRSTVRATMDELVILTRAVSRGCKHAMVIGDLPSCRTRCPTRMPSGAPPVREGRRRTVKLEGSGRRSAPRRS